MYSSLIALFTAFILDLLLGDPPNKLHPVAAMGKIIHFYTEKWNTGNSTSRFFCGMFLILTGGMLFSLPWMIIEIVYLKLPDWIIGIGVGIFLKPTFAFRGLLKAGKEVQQALSNNNLNEARRLVSWHLVSRNTSYLSSEQVTSATIESLAENLTDSFFAPLFYFAIGGLSLAWFYRFVNTADAMIGYHNDSYEYFGKFAARLDDILNWLPARFAGWLLVLAAALSKLDFRRAYRVMLQQHKQTSSPNAGWTMAAAAGALGVILEKGGHYRLEGGAELPEIGDIMRTRRLVAIALFTSLLFCGGLVIGRAFFF